MYYLIGEFAKITGVTVRTLHHYDEKGLLKPEKDLDSGHRRYKYDDLIQLQKITTFKFLGFSLKEIKKLITQKDFQDFLHKQKELMQKKKEETDMILKTIERIMTIYEEFGTVDENIIISSINDVHRKKEQKRWIEESLSERYSVIMDSISSEEEEKLAKQTAGIYEKIIVLSDKDPSNSNVQAVIEEFVSLLKPIVDIDTLKHDVNNLRENTNKSISKDNDVFIFSNPLSEKKQEFISTALNIYLAKRSGGE